MNSQHVFTYGSLMFAEVWRAVVAGSYIAKSAHLPSYVRHAVRAETYPAIVPAHKSGRSGVLGQVYLDVSADDLARLDAFEGAHYERRSCTVNLLDGGTPLDAQSYVYLLPERLLEHDWDQDWFAASGIKVFMATYCPTRE